MLAMLRPKTNGEQSADGLNVKSGGGRNGGSGNGTNPDKRDLAPDSAAPVPGYRAGKSKIEHVLNSISSVAFPVQLSAPLSPVVTCSGAGAGGAMRPCRDFTSSRGCRFGYRCKFAHQGTGTTVERPASVCYKHLVLGRCTAGPSCRLSHNALSLPYNGDLEPLLGSAEDAPGDVLREGAIKLVFHTGGIELGGVPVWVVERLAFREYVGNGSRYNLPPIQ